MSSATWRRNERRSIGETRLVRTLDCFGSVARACGRCTAVIRSVAALPPDIEFVYVSRATDSGLCAPASDARPNDRLLSALRKFARRTWLAATASLLSSAKCLRQTAEGRTPTSRAKAQRCRNECIPAKREVRAARKLAETSHAHDAPSQQAAGKCSGGARVGLQAHVQALLNRMKDRYEVINAGVASRRQHAVQGLARLPGQRCKLLETDGRID